MLALTGANGQLGRLVLKALQEKGARDIRALVRSPEKAADLTAPGVTLAEFDYDRPDTLVPALQGVTRLLLISGSEVGNRARQHKAVIDAAKAAGVSFIAYTSLLKADSSPLMLAEEHRATEADLAASGIAHVILRNGWYLENYAAAIASGLEHGAIAGAAGTGKISAASRGDYAEAAAGVLMDTSLSNGTFELAGSEAFTMNAFAAAVSELSGKSIAYADMEEGAYAALLEQAGLPKGFAAVLADSDAGAAKGGLFSPSRDLQDMLGRPSLSYKTYIGEALAALKGVN